MYICNFESSYFIVTIYKIGSIDFRNLSLLFEFVISNFSFYTNWLLQIKSAFNELQICFNVFHSLERISLSFLMNLISDFFACPKWTSVHPGLNYFPRIFPLIRTFSWTFYFVSSILNLCHTAYFCPQHAR